MLVEKKTSKLYWSAVLEKMYLVTYTTGDFTYVLNNILFYLYGVCSFINLDFK